MSKVDELIRELCPDGVQRVALGELLSYEQPGKYAVKSAEYHDEYKTPVLTAGQSFVLGYTNEEEGIYPASLENPVVIFDDFTTSFKWVDFPFKVKSSAMKLLKARSGERDDLRFIYYAMQTIHYQPVEHARQWIGIYSKFQIPLPPLQVQEEIVRILDQFVELDRELEQEIAGREKQFGIVRDKLLMLEDFEKVKLGEIGSVAMCKRIFKKETDDTGDVPFYKIGTFGKVADSFISQELFEEYKSKYPYPEAGDLLLSASGSIGRVVEFDGSASYFQDSNIVWLKHDETVLKNSFLKYCYQIIEWTTEGGTIKRLYNKNILDAEVPLPPLEVQEEIANKLDTFTEYIDSLKRERELRQKQYEYYRDQLLDFPVKE
ncbi:restriction endonuclease subunit S [Corynebacterium riegelii]|uniref:restriction endonuclease subunit S n=1 Tax=Corynebacterium riegelii TaxID=156976 RepID=UPI000C7908ED|nr:restriction endonuclease subunit S [Corynebacterium riegelii]PLA11039.1 restriction endonuclease subunit S [Corynebacterium riegelii]